MFFGLGADGTVGANKNSIKIIGQETDLYAQGYFVYDSKKSGAMTVSHLRSSKRPIRSAYLVDRATVRRLPPVRVRRQDRRARARGAGRGVSAECAVRHRRGLGSAARARCRSRSSTGRSASSRSMPTPWRRAPAWEPASTRSCRRASSRFRACLPRDEAIAHIKKSIEKTYGKRGPEVVRRNCEVVDQALAHLHEIRVPRGGQRAHGRRPPLVSERAPDFVQNITAVMLARQGRSASGERVSGRRHLADGDCEVGEAEHRARDSGVGLEGLYPVQSVRAGVPARGDPGEGLRRERAGQAPRRRSSRRSIRGNEYKGKHFTIQVAPEDCTGCNLCVNVCPAKDRTNPKHKAIDMHPQAPLRDAERVNYDFFLDLPEVDRTATDADRSQELAVPGAAVRVLGRLRGLRRDAVPEAAHAALRRPPAHRERHRLLVDLRRQPADDALHHESRRTRPGVVELALRGQRGVRLRVPDGARRPRRDVAQRCCRRSRRRSGDGLASGAFSTRIRRARPASRSSASVSRRSAPGSPAWQRPRPAGSRRSPTIS